MAELKASRTLVKSSPELWAECSDAASLARHLGAFGEIRITRLEPETAVAWEGEDVRGTVTLEPSGWGTRVVLTAETPPATAGALSQPVARPDPEPEPVRDEAGRPDPVIEDVSEQIADEHSAEPEAIEPGPAPRRGLFGRLFGFWRRPAPADAEPTSSAEATEPAETTEPAPEAPARAQEPTGGPAPEVAPSQVLVGALDSLGQAHKRPFSHG